jgi:AcrR family transcriptional regulator
MKSVRTSSKTRSYAQKARAEAAEATGERIINAFLARLMTQWLDEITLEGVAADAGVTVQTVIRRFGNKEGLLASGLKTLGGQINARRKAPSGDLDRQIGNLIADYEQTGDAVLRMLALEPRHAPLKPFLDYGRGEHRDWVAAAFAPALEKLTPAARQWATDRLVIVTDVYTWKLLRRDMGRGVDIATTTMKGLVSAVLADIS